MTTIERLQTRLTTLRPKAVEARLEGLLEQATNKEPTYADFLEELLGCEVDARCTRYLRARLQRRIYRFWFVHEASNVTLLGRPGVEKKRT